MGSRPLGSGSIVVDCNIELYIDPAAVVGEDDGLSLQDYRKKSD